MTHHESDMIRIARVLCIFFMMSVHVPPGSDPSFINTGDLAWLGSLWKDVLGRASVAALSFISGYLLIGSARRKSLAEMVRRRWSVLIIPMLFWNAVFVLLVVIAGKAGHKSGAFHALNEATPAVLVNLLTGIFGPTLNLSLTFLRDMFVCSVLILLCWRWIRAMPLLSVVMTLLITLFNMLDPLVLRPGILFFMVGGALAFDRDIALSRLADPRCSLPAAAACILSMMILSRLEPGNMTFSEPWLPVLVNLLLRSALVFLCLLIVDRLARHAAGRVIANASGAIFLVYLSHVPVMSMA